MTNTTETQPTSEKTKSGFRRTRFDIDYFCELLLIAVIGPVIFYGIWSINNIPVA